MDEDFDQDYDDEDHDRLLQSIDDLRKYLVRRNPKIERLVRRQTKMSQFHWTHS